MTESLKTQLLNYLGELMQEKETEYEYFERLKIQNKIHALHILLDLEIIK